MRPLAQLMAALALLGGCYVAHAPAGRRDGGATDVGTPDADPRAPDSPGPDGDCLTDAGFHRCDLDRCPYDRCTCYLFNPGEAWGLCVAPPGEEPTMCSSAEPCLDGLCMDLGATRVWELPPLGYCTSPELCEELMRVGDRAYCFYGDGTVYEGGTLARTPCDAGDRGALCGPDCGSCEPGYTCLGASETHGIGICVRDDEPELCGAESLPCSLDEGCLRFADEAERPISLDTVAGACLEEGLCIELAARYPERFSCDPHG